MTIEIIQRCSYSTYLCVGSFAFRSINALSGQAVSTYCKSTLIFAREKTIPMNTFDPVETKFHAQFFVVQCTSWDVLFVGNVSQSEFIVLYTLIHCALVHISHTLGVFLIRWLSYFFVVVSSARSFGILAPYVEVVRERTQLTVS